MQNALNFFRDVKLEGRKVVWPKFKETRGLTLVVLILCAIVALYLLLLDSVFGWAMKTLLGA